MITKTSGFEYLGSDCGWEWIPSVRRGLPEGSSKGVAVAVVIDGRVVATFPTYPPLWEAFRDGTIVDATSAHSVPEGHAVIELHVNGSALYTLHISNELLAAALTSNPTLAEITSATPAVVTGWAYANGNFTESA